MNIRTKIENDKQVVSKLALGEVIEHGAFDRRFISFYLFEHEISKFPEDLELFAQQLIRLHGYDPDILIREQTDEMLVRLHTIENEKILIVIIIYQ